MDKKFQINQLDKFVKLINSWIEETRKGGQNLTPKIEDNLQSIWGIIEEIFKQLGIIYSGPITDYSEKGIRTGDLFIDGFIGQHHRHSAMIVSIQKLKGLALSARAKIQTPIPLVRNTLPSLNLAINILNAFPDVASRLKHRRKDKVSLEMVDEYDVQDVIFAMMKGPFPTLQYENPNKKIGVTSSTADFTIEDLGLFIEVKYINAKGKERSVQEECKKDIISYSKQLNCGKIIFFIYDPNRCIDNEFAFKNGLGQKFSVDDKEVEIHTLIVR